MNLKILFELRKTKPTSPRQSLGRVFFFENKMGLSDASCTLWPVTLSEEVQNLGLKSGDIISFKGSFSYKNPHHESPSSKYDDVHFILNVEEVISKTPQLDSWKITKIPDPLPNFSNTTLQNKNFTSFYTSPSSARLKRIETRNKILQRISMYFRNRHFLNLETPTLVPSGGLESYLNPFETTYVDHRGSEIKLQLPTSPELAIKKILAEMPDKVFQIARAYRNQGELSQWHEPEFFMLEWYRVGGTLNDLLVDTQNLVYTLAEFLGSSFDVPKHWPRFRVDELFQKLLNLDLNTLQNRDNFYQKAKPLSFSIVETDDWNDIFCKLFMEKIEPFLKEQKACFVTHYPIQMAALAAPESDTAFAQRAEAFLDGVEICNAYFELVDAKNLQERIEKTKKLKPELKTDPVFENAMHFGLPPCAGNALGVDRVIAILLGEKNLSNLIPTPFLSQFLKGSVAED